jgi:hypothetical protein
VLLDVGDYLFVPVEAVFAAIEVRQEMSRDNIRYASEKVASVRTLRRTSAPVPYVEGKYKAKDLELHRIIGGLLTMDSEWKPPLGESFEKALGDFGGEGSLEIGCALRDGGFEVDDGQITRSGMDEALIFFVVRLLMRLQKMASPPAIEYDQYERALGQRTDEI